MKIHELKIEGFKSIGSITLVEPSPFSVFVGPNASGKSNIFEALEFFELCNIMIPQQAIKLFPEIRNFKTENRHILYHFNIDNIAPYLKVQFQKHLPKEWTLIDHYLEKWEYDSYGKMFHITNEALLNGLSKKEKADYLIFEDPAYLQFTNFTRLFVGNNSIVKINNQDDTHLSLDASNLEKVLRRILKDEKNRGEIIEILQLLVPGFSNVEVRTEELSGSDNLVVYEDALKKPLTRRLISDGTYNILALIAAIYQSDEPQFLCIEEPENGLNPKVVRQLVTLFRDKCKEKGHYIWLNTHSQTLVSELTSEEIILVDKVNGLTQVKQVKGFNLHGMKMDEALLTNALGGGIPW